MNRRHTIARQRDSMHMTSGFVAHSFDLPLAEAETVLKHKAAASGATLERVTNDLASGQMCLKELAAHDPR